MDETIEDKIARLRERYFQWTTLEASRIVEEIRVFIDATIPKKHAALEDAKGSDVAKLQGEIAALRQFAGWIANNQSDRELQEALKEAQKNKQGDFLNE